MEKVFQIDVFKEPIKVTIGKVAKQANGACLVQQGDSVVLVTATASTKPREGIDFLPLSCDYEEKMYAAGKIPGGFNKREGRPANDAVLISRLMDRPLRPLFPEGYYHNIQVVSTVLSYDPDYPTDILSMIGSSIALSISDIPFQGPTGSVRVGLRDGEFVLNPSIDMQSELDLDLVVAGTSNAIMMVEAGANLITEEEVLNAILFGHETIQKMTAQIDEIVDAVGKEKMEFEPLAIDSDLRQEIRDFAYEKVKTALDNKDKTVQGHALDAVREEVNELIEEREIESLVINQIMEELTQDIFRDQILKEHRRSDGRDFDEIRPLSSEVGLLPRTHGSGLFTRGQTQVLSSLTLASLNDGQIIDGLNPEYIKRYVHHYNFPSFSVGETRPPRSPGRREIGHGALAERALVPVLPSTDEFPYFIRIVSEVLESNGSSSMASVCGSTLSLMDAGVPIKAPVAGIAMGLISDGSEPIILTDIQGLEDHYGDMDFKVAGTKDGISALQMDIKIDGVDKEILGKALEKARQARLFILDHLHGTIEAPREELSPYAPLITAIQIDPDKIGEVIGSGGKMINKIIEKTGAEIEIDDDGKVSILSQDRAKGEEAKKIISEIVYDVKEGDVFTGTVKNIVNFGGFVEILWEKEGLLHISQIDHKRIDKVEDVLQVGDKVQVKVIGIDKGKISLSRKALLPKPDRN